MLFGVTVAAAQMGDTSLETHQLENGAAVLNWDFDPFSPGNLREPNFEPGLEPGVVGEMHHFVSRCCRNHAGFMEAAALFSDPTGHKSGANREPGFGQRGPSAAALGHLV